MMVTISERFKFRPIKSSRGRWTWWWRQFLDRKQYQLYFCATALNESQITGKMYAARSGIALLWKFEVVGANGGSDSW